MITDSQLHLLAHITDCDIDSQNTGGNRRNEQNTSPYTTTEFFVAMGGSEDEHVWKSIYLTHNEHRLGLRKSSSKRVKIKQGRKVAAQHQHDETAFEPITYRILKLTKDITAIDARNLCSHCTILRAKG
ncbi:uncharacterized protein ZBAI_01409 [Zygosaccharomyces bailii ISA1307]|nr:uncharacterized protein ZBAI_01409 [Zygosaccharomyces bailii ISA1307]